MSDHTHVQEADSTDFIAPVGGFVEEGVDCASCGGNLAGLSTLGMCPACGVAVRDTLAAEAPRALSRILNRAVACYRCGYNLMGLPGDGFCPECGEPVAASLRGDQLRYSAPEYLQTIHTGAVIILGAIIGLLLSVVISLVLSIVSAAINAPGLATVAPLLLLTAPFWVIAWLVGWWQFTARDPAAKEERASSRKLSRVFMIVYLACFLIVVLGAATLFVVGAGQGALGGFFVLVMLGALGMLVSLVLQYVYSMLYVSALARRIPDTQLAKWAKTLTWLGPLIYILGYIVVIGPLISLCMYWNAVDRVRKGLKEIRTDIEAAGA